MIVPAMGVLIPANHRRALEWAAQTLRRQAAQEAHDRKLNGLPDPEWQRLLVADFDAVLAQMSASCPDIFTGSADMPAALEKRSGRCTAKEAADVLKQSERHVRRLLRAGSLGAPDGIVGEFVDGRWSTTWEAVDAYLNREAS